MSLIIWRYGNANEVRCIRGGESLEMGLNEIGIEVQYMEYWARMLEERCAV